MATYLPTFITLIGHLSFECLCMRINHIVPLAMNSRPVAQPVEFSFLICDILFSFHLLIDKNCSQKCYHPPVSSPEGRQSKSHWRGDYFEDDVLL